MTPRELSEAFLAAYNAGDIEALADLIHDDIEYIRMGGERVDSKATIVDGYRASLEAGFVFELIRSTAEGDAVVIEILGRQQHPPHTSLQANDYHRWRDGKLVEYRAYVDRLDG